MNLIGTQRGKNQGCPLSVALFNSLLVPLVCEINHLASGVQLVIYADDISIIGRDPEEVQLAIDTWEQYLRILRVRLNPEKTQYVGLRALEHIFVEGRPIQKQASAVVLGIQLHTEQEAENQERAQAECKQTEDMLIKLAALPLALACKENAAENIIAARWKHTCWRWHTIPTPFQLNTWRCRQLAALRPGRTWMQIKWSIPCHGFSSTQTGPTVCALLGASADVSA